MRVRVECPDCGATLAIPDDLRGRKVRCRHCQSVFVPGKSSRVGAAEPIKVLPVDEEKLDSAPKKARPAKPAGRRPVCDDDVPRARRRPDEAPRAHKRRLDDEEEDGAEGRGVPVGWIVGIAVGGVVFLLAIILLLVKPFGSRNETGDPLAAQSAAPGMSNVNPVPPVTNPPVNK